MRMPKSADRGFSIIEAVVALAIVTTGVLALASLAAQVTESVLRARRHTMAAVLADQGVAMRLHQPLAATPLDCLQHDVAGCAETLDGVGRIAVGRAAFVRRWRVAAVGGVVPPALALGVCVVPIHERQAPGLAPGACIARIAWEAVP